MSSPAMSPDLTLQSLAPRLADLHRRLASWLHAKPIGLPPDVRSKLELEGLDLERGAAELAQEKPLLVALLMGGTGVGKSSLLNALAGGNVALASFTRPTTRDPVVYHHQSVPLERLPPELRKCRLVAHDRPALAQKILVDTPDLDSNEPENRDRLEAVLPLADVVLYVGSQEKYHDQAGWEMFLQQKQRRAFAFVLNKWDRCLHGLATGLRPDEDLLQDLKENGFSQPLIFRTCAQAWVESGGAPLTLPEGEQFKELERWLELGLNRLEIQAIKARGIGQLLAELEAALKAAKPPDFTSAAARAKAAWEKTLADEADGAADLLLTTIDPYQRDVEKHFAWHTHQHFRGLMAFFLSAAAKVRYWGGSWSGLKSTLWKGASADPCAAGAWDLAAFSQAALNLAGDRYLDARAQALPNRLLVLADQAGLPAATLAESLEAASKHDCKARFASRFVEVVHQAEADLTRPTGPRRWLLEMLVRIGEFLPLGLVLLSSAWLLYGYFLREPRWAFSWTDLLLPLAAIFFGMLILFVVIQVALPVRWLAIRGAISKRLRLAMKEEMQGAYLALPERLAQQLAEQRRHIEALEGQTKELADWLRRHEDATPVAALFEARQDV